MDQTTADDTYSEYSDECSTSAPLNIVTLTGSVSEGGSGPVIANSVITAANGENKVSIPVVSKASLPVMATPSTQNKEVSLLHLVFSSKSIDNFWHVLGHPTSTNNGHFGTAHVVPDEPRSSAAKSSNCTAQRFNGLGPINRFHPFYYHPPTTKR